MEPTKSIMLTVSNRKDSPIRTETLLHKQSSFKGESRSTVSKIRFDICVFIKQFIYHLLPPPLNSLLLCLVEGSRAATNQMMGSPIGHVRAWLFEFLFKVIAWIAFVLNFCGYALSPHEMSVLTTLYISRALIIAVKYGFRPQAEMRKYHSETDPNKVNDSLSQNLLSTWMSPTYCTIVNQINLASEHAAFKTNIDWFTQQENLKMKITFIGKERCNKVFNDILDIKPGSCAGQPQAMELDKCPQQTKLFGSVQGATRTDPSETELCELSTLCCERNDVHFLQVPAGMLISGLFLQTTKGTNLLSTILLWVGILFMVVLTLIPMFVRATTIAYFPEISQTNNITLVHSPGKNDSLAGLGYAMYIISSMMNGGSMLIFVLCSVVDYKRRFNTLEITRCLLRPHYSIKNKALGSFIASPPAIDLRIRQNIFGINLIQQTMLWFGKEYLLRLQFVLSFVLVGLLVIIVDTLSAIFFPVLSTNSDTLPPLYLKESVVFGLVFANMLLGIILASLVFANFANREPEYFQHAMASQSLGIHSDIMSLYDSEMDARSKLEAIEFGDHSGAMDSRTGFVHRRSVEVETEGKEQGKEQEKEQGKEKETKRNDESATLPERLPEHLSKLGKVEKDKEIKHLKRVIRRNERNRLKLKTVTEAIDHSCQLVRSTDMLYPIELLGVRADWKQMSAVAAGIGALFAAILRATN